MFYLRCGEVDLDEILFAIPIHGSNFALSVFTQLSNAMQKIITFLLLLIGVYAMPCLAMAEQDGDVKDLQFVPEHGGIKNNPMKPAYTPIYGEVSGDVLTIYSKVNGTADITVSAVSGKVIISQSVDDLTCGYTVILPAESIGITVRVIFNGVTYSATI